VRELKTDGLLPVETKLRSSKYLNNLIEQDHRGVKQRIAVMLGSRGPAMQRSRSPASSYCIALGGDSSDWDVSAFKIELHLQSGTRCLEPEFRAATQRLFARAGHLHQGSPRPV
jgi:hypothetical protein